MRFLKWIICLIPFFIGLALDLSIVFRTPQIPILYLRADIGVALLLTGFLASAILGIAVYLQSLQNQAMDSQAEQIHADAADERRRFLQRLDHELKNPLTAIRAGLANISEAPDSDSLGQVLESVEAQTLRLSRLAADLRKLAELETRPLERSQVDIGEMLQEAYTLAQDQLGSEERKLTLTIPQAPWPLPKVPGDPDLLFLAVHNLLDNAIKFTHSGDTVEVRAFEDGAQVVIEIADTGPGIPEEELPHVWEELYRGEGARGVPGSGLGLALVRAISDRHSGRVGLRSRKGQGTVFSLRLPVE